ncbi:exopolysaccharide biosynthesis predicted pyruvyl transferase EpsI [Fontibacillus solani]|uniref:Exopolysaccharide biosynthesis predicted pyruvyl transferase EpsI n=1 Tax=Fontibacillus solani TaxID=1572857 RepID=A0A7W3SQZ3_9BACL|nr:polysaccharide pyruvyl transferase family protein [Fontibacillus solani]MBA9084517.1 exopolysaccharide biosynthesis predicted pyruvyl transferase EpsI [Fontibacillus solani]
MDKLPNGFSDFRTGLETSRCRILSELTQAEDVTFFTCGGNIGDYLIWAGTRHLLHQFKYKEATHREITDSKGHTALITGSGGWSRAHRTLPMLLPEIEKRFEKIIILPSSYDPGVDTVKRALSQTRAKVFVRELESYRMVKDLCNAELAYDCAFFFDFSPYRIQGKGEGELHAYRTDGESAITQKPSDNYDISNNYVVNNLDTWLHIISQYERIRTDRAHIMVAGAMLGKTVYYTSSNYHKLPGIAKFSLREYPVYPEKSGQ